MTLCNTCRKLDINSSCCSLCASNPYAQFPAGSLDSYSTSSYGEADKYALRKLWIFAIITLAGSTITAAFLAWQFALFPGLFSHAGIFGSVEVPNNIAHWYARAVLSEFMVINTLMITAIFPLRSVLVHLSRAGSSGFRTPSMAMLGMLVCLLLTVVGRLLDPMITSPVPHWMLAALGLILSIGTYGTIAGVIVGETLGIYRMGSRYKENLFKAASIPLVIPVVQIISPIMILIGLHRISRNILSTKSSFRP